MSSIVITEHVAGREVTSIVTLAVVMSEGLRSCGLTGVDVFVTDPEFNSKVRGKTLDYVILRMNQESTSEQRDYAMETARAATVTKNGRIYALHE